MTTTPGKFDYYVLALSWQPAFCEGHPGKTECTSQTGDRYDAKNLVLHGLWPSRIGDKSHRYGFCGVSKKVRKLDQPGAWCKMPDLNLASDTTKDLAVYMPGYASCLQNHEWYKHGSCSGLNANDYFQKASGLVARMSDTGFDKFISANVGKTVATSDLLAEFEKDFGSGSRKYVNLFCDRGTAGAMLSEVRLYLKKQLPGDGDLSGALVQPEKSERGNCPEEVMIDEAGLSAH